ncbi:uncharacterized protein LOC129899393 isoform X1 [Solanum dulcamara]|uniref:uncharacterized protein LOC129899393 isoform X1 n=2 Tax=Solanum dulcamara TaxID=45834 RepID=UPI002486A9C9|nr:uncharacterized protein LOC129899393 isoform X1 [Solanum dulcamara]XP_055830318.1 uncharacterized protein LOC129899393 isoform X1 [Solanum dulcamara]XP_055830319.1 uncharacterized protein LOC129899393 isoform X1 [Solanum dulcamara]
MCAMAESETWPQCMDSKHEKHCFSHIRSSCSCSPLCISGKDGSKYEHSRISSRNSRVASGSPKNSISNKASKYGCHLRKKESVDENDSKPSYLKQKADSEGRDLSFVLDQSSGSISPCISSAYGQPEEVNKMIDDEKEIMLEKNSLYRGSKHTSEAPHCSNISHGNTVANANARNIRNSSRTIDELQSETNISHSYIEGGNTSIISVGQVCFLVLPLK